MQVHQQSGWTPPNPDRQCPHLHHPPSLTPNALPAATLPIYPCLGQAPNMLDCIPGGLTDLSVKGRIVFLLITITRNFQHMMLIIHDPVA